MAKYSPLMPAVAVECGGSSATGTIAPIECGASSQAVSSQDGNDPTPRPRWDKRALLLSWAQSRPQWQEEYAKISQEFEEFEEVDELLITIMSFIKILETDVGDVNIGIPNPADIIRSIYKKPK